MERTFGKYRPSKGIMDSTGKNRLKFGAVITLVGTLLAVFGGFIVIEDRYAKCKDVTLVELRLNEKILADRANYMQERMWKLEDRYGAKSAQELDEYRRLKRDRDDLLRRLPKAKPLYTPGS